MSITNIKPIDKRNDVFSAMYDNNDIIIKVVDKKEKATLETLKDAKFNNVVKIYNIYTYNDFFVKFHCDLSITQGIIFKQNISYYLSNYVVIMEKLNTYNDEIFKSETYYNKQHFFKELETAINQIHSIDVYHGDLKLQNIGNINNIIKIFDFGDCGGIKSKDTDINDFNKLKKYVY